MEVLEYSSKDSVDTEEKMANLKTNGKEITVQDALFVDKDGCLHMTEEVKLGGNYKGKGLLFASSNGGDFDNKKASFYMEQSSSSASAATDAVVSGDYSNDFTGHSFDTDQDEFDGEEDYFEYLPENQWYGMDEILYLQTQFEKTDIPPDIEVDIPWWSDPGHKNGKPINLSGPYNGKATQPLFDSGVKFDQTALAPEIKSIGGSNNQAADSFASAQTETLGGSCRTPSSNSLKEAAMTRVQQFENFAVVDDYSDHHYAKVNMPLDMQLHKASAKKIQDEWRILQSSLPDTIFVRVYESQMALLRALIIGPQGTPYHDGLFFFDVMFPSNYPNQPPHVYYYSGGLRLNPNLYANGKVCLSLLGTWPGRSATENWVPGKSTLLQVLVSIQALILNANPYFNEPANLSYGVSQGKSASELYSEEMLLKSLKTMIYSMKKPPRHFEEFVPDYFITRSRDIVLACKEYMNGAQVGSVSILEGMAVKEMNNQSSLTFRARVGNYLNLLIDEFIKLGVNDCYEFRATASNINELAMTEDDLGGLSLFDFPESDPDVSQMQTLFTPKFGKAEFKPSSSQFMPAPFPTAPGVPFPTPPGVLLPFPFPTPPEFKPSSSQFKSEPFPTASGVQYPFLIPPPNMYTAPYTAAPDDAYPIPPSDMYAELHPAAALDDVNPVPQPPPLSTTTSQMRFPHFAAYPFPPSHIALSSSFTPRNPSLSMSVHTDPSIRFGRPPSHMQNIGPVIYTDPPARLRPPWLHMQNVGPVVNSAQPARFRPSPGSRSRQRPSKPDDDLKGNVHKWSDS